MGLLQTLRGAVKTAHKLTLDLQPTILYRQTTGQDGAGGKTYNPPVESPAANIRAIVEDKQEVVRTSSGQLSQSKTHITILDIATLSALTGGLGVKEGDSIVLPSGETGPILSVSGFIDRGTGIGLVQEVYLG